MLTINGHDWQIQIVLYPLAYGFEVSHQARLIRVEFTADSQAFAERVAQAVAGSISLPVYSRVD